MYHFIELSSFSRYRENFFSDEQFSELQRFLIDNPKAGDVIPGTRGVRKLRWMRTGMGKRSGLRVIYFVQDDMGRIWLLTVYGKNARENISVKTLNALRETAKNAEII